MVADLTGKWPGFVLKELRRGRPDLRGKLATAKRSEAGFDFVYDWGLLHHIPFSKRLQYVKNVHRVLKPEGKYVSVCFNVKDTAFEGRGKKRKTQLGTFVYLSSKPELRKLFGRFFKIIDFRVLKIQGRIMSHVFNYCFMEKKTNH
jgi:SAM-dependent methyltransferase